MEPYAECGGEAGGVTAGEEGSYRARQHVAGTSYGKLRDIPRRYDGRFARNGDERSSSLEYPYGRSKSLQFFQRSKAVGLYFGGSNTKKQGGFAGMRSENVAGAKIFQQVGAASQCEERIGIQHHRRAMRQREQGFREVCRAFTSPKAGAENNSF